MHALPLLYMCLRMFQRRRLYGSVHAGISALERKTDRVHAHLQLHEVLTAQLRLVHARSGHRVQQGYCAYARSCLRRPLPSLPAI